MRWSAPVLLVAALAVGACGGHYVNRGADLYSDGRYVEAAEVFERTQGRLASSPPAEQARYGLYRGATLFVLGDFAHAHSWLTYAHEVERRHPGALAGEERAFLERLSFAVEARFRGLPQNTSGSAVAASQQPAGPPPSDPQPPPDLVPAPTQTPTQRSFVGQ